MERIVLSRHLNELFPEACRENEIRARIHSDKLKADWVTEHFSSALSLDATIAIFVLAGTAKMLINYKPHTVSFRTLVLLSPSHVFRFCAVDPRFRCVILFVSKEYMSDRDSRDMIYRRIKYGAQMYARPVVELTHDQLVLLLDRLSALDEMINKRDHLYQEDMILNHLFAFYLDLSNILDSPTEVQRGINLTRYESIVKAFIELLTVNFRSEHRVEFYASHLNISMRYLTQIVQSITGRSASDFIFEMLYSEARNLLTHSCLSIQEIASVLHFSSQSAFGKFFRHKSGMSPSEYRRKL